MKSSIKVSAPATVANMGCGYDSIGFALDYASEEIVIERRDDEQLVIKSIEGADLSIDPEQNVATVAVKSFLHYLDIKEGFDFSIRKLFPPGSGLGSSASSASGAVFGVNQLLKNPLETSALLPFALEGEAFASGCYHADNVAPALLGGCIAIRSYDPLDYFSLPVAEELKVLIVKPYVEIKTSEAKGLIPKQVDIGTARNQWGNLSSLVHALHTKDWIRMNDSIEDFIAEPVRKSLIPGYDEVKRIAQTNNSVGCNISGSGPSIFMFFLSDKDRSDAKAIINEMYQRRNISCDFFFSKMSPLGCKIVD